MMASMPKDEHHSENDTQSTEGEEDMEMTSLGGLQELAKSAQFSGKDNFILTFSGDLLSYTTLDDETDIEDGQSNSAKEDKSESDKRQRQDMYYAARGMCRARQRSCCYWFYYELRKWKWKIKNCSFLRHFIGDLRRNTDKVPRRLALLIEEEVLARF